jgi:hypothetical protein
MKPGFFPLPKKYSVKKTIPAFPVTPSAVIELFGILVYQEDSLLV